MSQYWIKTELKLTLALSFIFCFLLWKSEPFLTKITQSLHGETFEKMTKIRGLVILLLQQKLVNSFFSRHHGSFKIWCHQQRTYRPSFAQNWGNFDSGYHDKTLNLEFLGNKSSGFVQFNGQKCRLKGFFTGGKTKYSSQRFYSGKI